MDHFLAIVRRLTPAVVGVLLLVVSFLPRTAYAFGTYDAAMSNCQAAKAYDDAHAPAGYTYTCDVIKDATSWKVQDVQHGPTGALVYKSAWRFDGDPPPENPCIARPPPTLNGSLAGKYLQGYSYCAPTTDANGGTVMCRMSVSVSGPPTMNRWGSWRTPGSTSNTGSLCDGTPGDGGIRTAGGSKPVPMPSNPNTDPPKNPPPKACGGGSCYDPTNDNFCAVSGSGDQFCIPGNIARQPGGGCASSGDSTLCAGSPSAPSPPASQVPDPPTAVRSNDSYTQADPSTGGNQNVTVINYTNQGAPPATSGQQTGDSGPPASGGDPASGSSTSSNPGSYSGGGDCGSPPVCSGDAVMCGVARQQWTAMCQAKKDAAQLHTDLTGTGAPSDLDALKGKYGQGDVWSDADTSQDSTVGGKANAGTYDTTGFGYGTACPLKDISVSLGSRGTFVIPLQDKCMVGDWLRALVLGFALFTAAIITAGGRGS